MKWLTTCKETTELASRAMDARLSFGERLALGMHLAICANCARFARQIKDMRTFLRMDATDDAGPHLTEDARRRIETELQNKLDH
ncbi:MAG: zf-HC2 domain-containing protein [Pseudomonadota bacterium]